MSAQVFGQYLYEMSIVVLIYAGPPLAVATGTGFIIALFQALTQIQDQSLPQAFKMFAVGVVLVTMGQQLSRPLIDLTVELYRDFPVLVR